MFDYHSLDVKKNLIFFFNIEKRNNNHKLHIHNKYKAPNKMGRAI